MTVTIGSAVLAYISEREHRGEITGQSPKVYRKNLWLFAIQVGVDRDVRRLNRRAVEGWANRQRVAPATLRMRIALVRGFCQWLVRKEYLRKDPSVDLRGPRAPRHVPRGRTRQDVARIFAACPDLRAEVIVSLMTQEGLRCCEVSGLQLGDIDVDDRAMFVRGKGRHERVLPITDETWRLLRSYIAAAPATAGPLIRSHQQPTSGLSSHYISGLVGRIIRDAGVQASAHALRHTAASDMLRAGAHLRDVQAALGHQSLKTTERYLPWVVRDLRQAMGGRTYRPGPVCRPDGLTTLAP